jgi:hypothetical protein
VKPSWQWDRASRSYGNFGNANQWTVNAGLSSLARESAQNSNDARGTNPVAELVYTFIRLSGQARADFEAAVSWHDTLLPHLRAMGSAAGGAVAAGQIRAGVEAVEANDSLLLLKVADYGCRGLTGPEFPEDGVDPDDYGNFIRLCRLDLFSGKAKAAGGSFGLGKAVFWRFSRLQTVLFNSCLQPGDAVNGNVRNRVFGVNQGVLHTLGAKGYQGRGYFGVPDPSGDAASIWATDEQATALHLERTDTRPGTSALLIGFYDPDSPERGLDGGHGLIKLARELQAGVEESFWPLLARGRLKVRVQVEDEGEMILDQVADPEETYTELVRALHRFDTRQLDDQLGDVYSTVARDIPIKISERRDGRDDHPAFEHTAKLVVTVSDQQPDSLENSVCMFRKPEMVVQTLKRDFEGRTFHAFLLAGGAIEPDSPTIEQVRADDFLRFSEPPAHDRWIPGSGRGQTSQANLTARYKAPWLPNLRDIEKNVLDELFALFDAPPPLESKGPESVLKHLRFLRGQSGSGGSGGAAPRKPLATLTAWQVVGGAWNVTFQLTARNRSEGYLIQPQLRFIGLDGGGTPVAWDSLAVVSGGALMGDMVHVPGTPKGRKLTAVVHGVSTTALPIPASEAAIDVVVVRFTGGPDEEATA